MGMGMGMGMGMDTDIGMDIGMDIGIGIGMGSYYLYRATSRFATTADDKKMLIWEFGIPVPIKHIADPTQHSMPAVTKTPNDKWMLCQNLDNQITTYSASDRFKLNRKKTSAKFYDPTGSLLRMVIELNLQKNYLRARVDTRKPFGGWSKGSWVYARF